MPIVLGDARLMLTDVKEPADIIVLDAFSSDVVPVHLLTREAIDLYMSKLAPGGALVFHISNRYLELASVVTATAAEHGLTTLVKRDRTVKHEDFRSSMKTSSIVAVVARHDGDLAGLGSGWIRQNGDPSVRVWTDDFSNVLAAMWRMAGTR